MKNSHFISGSEKYCHDKYINATFFAFSLLSKAKPKTKTNSIFGNVPCLKCVVMNICMEFWVLHKQKSSTSH